MRSVALSVILLATCCLPSSLKSEANEKKPVTRAFSVLIFDAQTFVSQLPKKTLISIASAKNDFNRDILTGIKALGPIPNVEFIQLPPDAEKPVAKDRVNPVYPRGSQGEGEVSLLFLIGASGNVTAIYCYQFTNKAFAINAATAVAHWHFVPARLQKIPVPMLVHQTISFDQTTHY